MLEYRNIKIFLQKITFPIGLKKALFIIEVKNNAPPAYVFSDFKGEEIVGTFNEKEFQKRIKNNVKLKK